MNRPLDLSFELAAFQEAVKTQTRLADLAPLFAQAARPLGVTAYAMGQLRGGDQPARIFITTWPKSWMELYAANGFIQDDPIVLESLENPEPFSWADLTTRRSDMEGRVLSAARRFGFHTGFVVPVHGPLESRGLVAYAGADMDPSADQRRHLVALGQCCYAAAKRLVAGSPPRVALAPREREVLALVARGMDDGAIAVTIGVTRASAHAYVERAKRRLGAATRAQAVAMAVAEGLI